MAKITELQRNLDRNYEKSQKVWGESLEKMELGEDFTVQDGEDFYKAVTMKSVRNWAVSQELEANHAAQKKIIDSI